MNVVVVWVRFTLNPHPFRERKGAAPKCRSEIARFEYLLGHDFARLWRLTRDHDQQLNAGVNGVDQVVFAVDFVDVDGVGVSPARWPRIVVNEIVSAVVEAAIVIARYAESVLAAEVRVEVGLRDATRVAVIAVALRLLILRVILSRDLLLLLLFRGLLLLLVCGLLLLFGGV